MEKLKFEFRMRGAADGKTNVLCITSIETPDERRFALPDEFQPASQHTTITNQDAFKKIKNSLTRRNQYRRIWIPLNDEMRKVYLDEGENLQFGDYFLDEMITNVATEANPPQTETLEQLIKTLIETSQRSEKKSIDKIAKEMTINKFDNKNQNASQWMDEFESECDRFNIMQSDDKIKLLKLFLEKSCLDWYECTLIKLKITSDWSNWRRKFKDTFASKGWLPIRYAINFKYQSGSLVEYALKKEKLLLETRKEIDTGTLIDLIAVGLPDIVSNRLDRNTLMETEDLYNELGKLEHLAYRKTKITEKSNDQAIKKKTPCMVCKNKLNKIRYHPEEKCWFKENQDKDKKYNSLLDVESDEQDPKNL